jgi:hypothetical protein
LPSKEAAFANLPAAQPAPTSVAPLPSPEMSEAAVPVPSSKP